VRRRYGHQTHAERNHRSQRSAPVFVAIVIRMIIAPTRNLRDRTIKCFSPFSNPTALGIYLDEWSFSDATAT